MSIHTSQSFDCEGGTILFRETEFPGMVGETCSVLQAIFIPSWGMAEPVKEITYEEVKGQYKNIQGRRERMAFHCWMKRLSPEGILQKQAEELADAISRVR